MRNTVKDSIIYERLLQRDEVALEDLINQYKDLFYKIVCKVLQDSFGNSDIEDCISESIVYIWYHIHLYDPEKYSFHNWIALIIRSRALNTRRKLLQNQRKYHITLLERSIPDVVDIIIARETYQQIVDFIELQKKPMKEVMIRRYLYGQKPREISRVMGLSIVKINYFLYEGKKKLRGMMEMNSLKF